jgi:nitrogen fixation NifU-like protein
MTDAVKGQPVDTALALFERFHEMVTTPPERDVDRDAMGKLGVLAGVREFPVRVKCASLAWHTLKAALEKLDEPVRTED